VVQGLRGAGNGVLLVVEESNRRPRVRLKSRGIRAKTRRFGKARESSCYMARESPRSFSFGSSLRPLTRAPLLGSNLPDFRWQPARNEVPIFGGNDAHSLPLRNSARGFVGGRLRRSEDRELQNVKPIVGYDIASFAHQPLPLPWQTDPEPTIVILGFHQRDHANHARRIALEP
jgi:hypothetical protein